MCWLPPAILSGGALLNRSRSMCSPVNRRLRSWPDGLAARTPAAWTRSPKSWGDLPLALEQASAYIEETVIPIGEYVSLFTERAAELFNLGRTSTTEQTIATIWTLSLKQIHNDTPAAQDLLTLCGFLAPDDIPRRPMIFPGLYWPTMRVNSARMVGQL